MIDHTGVIVSDFARSVSWYKAALAPLGYGLLYTAFQSTDIAGFGELATAKPDFWLGGATPDNPVNTPGIHIAFRAATRKAVDEFYQAALAAGGCDNGPPGLRPHYHAHYYGAFVLDPDGHNIEAVCHDPP